MTRPDFLLTNLELRASNPDGTEGEGLSHRTGGIVGAGTVLVQVLELGPSGEPDGAAIIVHDAGDHGARYEDLAVALTDAGWMVSLPDLRGHGRSEGVRGHVTGLPEPVRDIHSVRGHVAYRMPDAKTVVIGVGLGALWAMAYAVAHEDEVAGLVLAAPLVDPAFRLPERKGGLMGLFKKVGPESPGSIGWTASDLFADAGAAAAWGADDRVQDVITLGAGEVVRAAMGEVPGRCGALGKPTLVLAGAEDPLAPPAAVETLAAALGAECRTIPGSRHAIFHDGARAEAFAAVTDWLRALA